MNFHHLVLSFCYNADAFILFNIYCVLHVLDEAPDSGDDSDDDLITNYLGGGHPGALSQVAKGANGAGGGAIPSIHLTSSQASSTNHILGKTSALIHLYLSPRVGSRRFNAVPTHRRGQPGATG